MIPSAAFRVACVLVTLPLLAEAQMTEFAGPSLKTPSRPAVALVLEGALEMGGSRVATTTFTDGSTQTMQAGQGGTFAVGAEVRPSAGSPLVVRGTVGWKFVTTAASNTSIGLTRVPLELVASWSIDNNWRVGAGYVRHTAIEFDAGGFGPDVSFDDANGATIEVGWRKLSITYTAMEYTDEYATRYNASSGGISFVWTVWPRARVTARP